MIGPVLCLPRQLLHARERERERERGRVEGRGRRGERGGWGAEDRQTDIQTKMACIPTETCGSAADESDNLAVDSFMQTRLHRSVSFAMAKKQHFSP